jgi:hypothetical protein
VLTPTDSSAPFVEGIAVRLGHECRMHRECAVASQPPSQMLERMASNGMILVCMLLLLCYDNALTIFRAGNPVTLSGHHAINPSSEQVIQSP